MMFITATADIAARIRSVSSQVFLQPLITTVIFLFLYAGHYVVHEGSLTQGLMAAFVESDQDRVDRLRRMEDQNLQLELRHAAESNKVIDGLLTSLTEADPRVARAQLDIIHNGVSGVTGIGLLRYDVTNSIAAPGHVAGPLVQNRPLSEWSDFLPDLLAGTCRMFAAADLRNEAVRTRMAAVNGGMLLICPAADMQKRTLGAILLFWDAGVLAPQGEALERLKDLAKLTGQQIASVLDLRAVATGSLLHAPHR